MFTSKKAVSTLSLLVFGIFSTNAALAGPGAAANHPGSPGQANYKAKDCKDAEIQHNVRIKNIVGKQRAPHNRPFNESAEHKKATRDDNFAFGQEKEREKKEENGHYAKERSRLNCK